LLCVVVAAVAVVKAKVIRVTMKLWFYGWYGTKNLDLKKR
jgi:hypothetical protein